MTCTMFPNGKPGSGQEKKTKSEYVPDFKKLTKPQLLELLERQNKLISSPALSKLPDKGEKAKYFKIQIEEELTRKNNSEDLCDELTRLNITEKKVDTVEWGGDRELTSPVASDRNCLQDDENDTLAIIATHSGTVNHQRKVKIEEPDKPLIMLEDIEEAYAIALCNKIDKASPKPRFLPHKTLNKTITPTKSRDLSAATPPLPTFGDVKQITLEESVKLQYEQTQHLKEVQQKHATERLKDLRFNIGNRLPNKETLESYREPKALLSEEESGPENEVNEE